jgi:hypothetical protein
VSDQSTHPLPDGRVASAFNRNDNHALADEHTVRDIFYENHDRRSPTSATPG